VGKRGKRHGLVDVLKRFSPILRAEWSVVVPLGRRERLNTSTRGELHLKSGGGGLGEEAETDESIESQKAVGLGS
jgi:hypothetical protein